MPFVPQKVRSVDSGAYDYCEMLKVNKKYIGIIYIVISAFFFALMNLFVKLAGDVPVMQKCFFRNIVAVFFSLTLLLRDKSAFLTGKGHFFDLFMRSLAGTLGVFCNFYAIGNMNIADASILNKLSPFFAIIFSYFLLKEKPKLTEWIAVGVAFAGALLVVKPSFSAEVLPAVSGVLGGLGAGIAYTFVRKMGKSGVNGNLIVFCFSAFSCAVTLPVILFDYFPMSLKQFSFLMLAGVSAAGGQIFITKAYSNAPAKEISVYDYCIVIFTSVLGFLFLNELPDWLSVIGYCVIVFAAAGNCYLTIRAERKTRAAQTANVESESLPRELPSDKLQSNESTKTADSKTVVQEERTSETKKEEDGT